MCTVAMDADSSSQKPKIINCGLLQTRSLLRHDKKTSSKPPSVKPEDLKTVASAVAACKLGLVDQLVSILETSSSFVDATDIEGRTCLHYAAGYGHEECVDTLLSHSASVSIRDCNGDTPLHFAAVHGHPMCAYTLAKAEAGTCLVRNVRGQNPVEVAAACERREVLNAMLLSCAGDAGSVAVEAMRLLLVEGAVPDTWAPNGSSALMLAAAADGTEALEVLVENGASIELQDALGRSALMFAAGNGAANALNTLLDAGACIAARDRRGRSVLEYAADGSDAKQLLQHRLQALEDVAAKLQEDLLASLDSKATSKAASSSRSKSKRKKSKASKRSKADAAAKRKAHGEAEEKAEGMDREVDEQLKVVEEHHTVKCTDDADAEADERLLSAEKVPSCYACESGVTDAGSNGTTDHNGSIDTAGLDADKLSVDMSLASNPEDDDPSAWHVVGKSQRSSSKVITEAAPASAAKKREASPSPAPKHAHKPLHPTRSNMPKDPVAPGSISLANTMPFHSATTAADSTFQEPASSTRVASKPPVPTPVKADPAPRSTALKPPPNSALAHHDAAWPCKPLGTSLGFKAALLGQSNGTPFSSSPRSTCSSSTFTCEPILAEMPLDPTPAEMVAATQESQTPPALQAWERSMVDPATTAKHGSHVTVQQVHTSVSVGIQTALETEVEMFRRQVAALHTSQQQLRRQLQLADLKHQQELSAVLEDAAQHKLEAMAMAAQHERTRLAGQLQLLGFSSELLRALLDPSAMDLLSLIDAPHSALPLADSTWTPSLFDTSSVTTSKWANLAFPSSKPLNVNPGNANLNNSLFTTHKSPFKGFDSHPTTFPSPGVNVSSRNGSRGSFTAFTDSGSNVSLSISPLSTGSPCMSSMLQSSAATSLFSKPFGTEGQPANELPNLPDSLDDDFASRLSVMMEHFTPFGCGKQLHSFVDPIKDIPLPESALVGNL